MLPFIHNYFLLYDYVRVDCLTFLKIKSPFLFIHIQCVYLTVLTCCVQYFNICMRICANMLKRISANDVNKWCMRTYRKMQLYSHTTYSRWFASKRIIKDANMAHPTLPLHCTALNQCYLHKTLLPTSCKHRHFSILLPSFQISLC